MANAGEGRGAGALAGALAGRAALVTGGSGAIGAASALALLRDGAAVLLMAREGAALEQARADLLAVVPEGTVGLMAGDAVDEAAVEAAVRAAHGLRGRLDIVVATVGQGGAIGPITATDAAAFRAVVERNLTSAFLAIKHAAPRMGAGGSIVCISSTVAKRVSAGSAAYIAAKAGLEGLVQAAAEELSGAGIRVNAVRPGPVRSRLRAAFYADPAIAGRFLERLPLGRLGDAEDIAGAVRYLAGPESGWVTGQSLAVDGGSELRGQPDLSGLFG